MAGADGGRVKGRTKVLLLRNLFYERLFVVAPEESRKDPRLWSGCFPWLAAPSALGLRLGQRCGWGTFRGQPTVCPRASAWTGVRAGTSCVFALGLQPHSRTTARPERRYRPPGGTGLRRRALRRVRKSLAGHYYQLLSGHAAIGSFPHGRMTGPQRLDTDKCWWCSCGKQQTRHRLFTGCRAWAPQIRRLWKRIGRDCQ